MKLNNFLICSVLACFVLISCKSTKEIYTDHADIKNISDNKLIKSVESNYLTFNSIYIKKYNADISINGSKRSFSGSLFIQRDSQVVMTVAPLLGIELFRAKISNDSVFLIDRTKREVHLGSYNFIEKNIYLDVNFEVVQSILTNEFFIVNDNDPQQALKRFKHYVTDDHYTFNSVKSNRLNRNGKVANMIQSFNILPGVFKINQSYIQDAANQSSMTVKYSELTKVGDVWFPSKIQIVGNKGNQNFELTLSFNSVSVDSSNKINFNLPTNYKLISVK